MDVARPLSPPDTEQNAIVEKVVELIGTHIRTNQLPTTVYHYTNSAGLKGIIESGVMRATHLGFMNDATEYLHAADLLRDKVVAARELNNNGPARQMLDEMEKNLKETTVSNMYPQFVTCFSEKPNDLSQWRAYGQGEGGFSIGFSSLGLKEAATRNQALFCRVIYDRHEQSRIIQSLLDWAIEEYCRRAASSGAAEGHRIEWLTKFFRVAAQVAPMIKNPKFSEEDEWRIIQPLLALGNLGFVPKPSALVPYSQLRLGTAQPAPKAPNPQLVNPLPDLLPMTVVWAGPGRFKEASLLAAQGLLVQCNYIGVTLEKSDIPYRVVA
jgi:hypothetical protein